MFLSLVALIAATSDPGQPCTLSFSRTTGLARRDHPVVVCVEPVPGPEPREFQFRLTVGPRARRTMIASRDCPVARVHLANLSRLVSPTPFVTDVDGPEIIPVRADGTRYRLETSAHYGDEPNLGMINNVTLIVEADSDSPLARWVDGIVDALNDCAPVAP